MSGRGVDGEARALRAALVGRWDFVPPKEAPLFVPTREEFLDPLAYISSIRHVAEPCGICRIRPPDRWRPPFALDVDSLRFVPRKQRLRELEGLTRLRLHFGERLERFWRLSGRPLRKATLRGKDVDLFALYRLVKLDGGRAECSRRGKWPRIASMLGVGHSAECGLRVEELHAKVLAPFEELLADETLESKPKREPGPKGEPGSEPKRAAVAPGGMMRRQRKQRRADETKCGRELRRLACYGAGPKMPGVEADAEADADADAEAEAPPEEEIADAPRRKRSRARPDASRSCRVCGTDRDAGETVRCEDCGDVYHLVCARPSLRRAPDGEWKCRPCLADDVRRPPEPFGFAQAEREYTLQEFGEMADRFKSDHFGTASHLVPPAVAEKEFWRIVSSPDEDVTVEYGADLHSMDHGSGFPTRSSLNLFQGDQEYVDSGWNLNNLPVLENSVLRFINDDISGMTVPWMYVGMCFSAFCWHNEDHWSYSINFLHWGEVKTWYGVPGAAAELLEETMRRITPELFDSQPDLLHQLVTILNPNILSEAGVPVYRTDQNPGEFVVTFPRSYHAGFNQGYNFAEAVNFAPPDWIAIGRDCVLHYKNLKRFCVFSHDELVCKIALAHDEIDIKTVIPTLKELSSMVALEAKRRGEIFRDGVKRCEMRSFELLADDERLCEACKTTCFLSALVCDLCRNMVCLDHVDDGCDCPKELRRLEYRYTLDELHLMLENLRTRVELCDRWATRAKRALASPSAPDSDSDRKKALEDLLEEANAFKIPKCRVLEKLEEEHAKISKMREVIIIELDD